jgi:hypothetical protein
MTTALTISRANEIYSKIENPMLAVAELGKMFHQSQIMGVATPGDGAVLALTCMCEGITPLEFAKTYHIIKGRPSMKADAMSARFRQSGGKCRWINLGDDGKEAKAEFSFDGQTLEIGYTIDDAKKVMGKDDKGKDRIDQPDSNWSKDRGAMLRARLITKAIRIIAPELIAGVYTPEELEDSGAVSAAAPTKDRASRKKELEADTTTAVVQPVEEPVIDVVVEPAPFAADAAAVSDDSDLPTTNELLHELVLLGKKMPSQLNPGSSMDLAEVAAGVRRAAKVDEPKQATRGQIRKLIEAFRKALGEK